MKRIGFVQKSMCQLFISVYQTTPKLSVLTSKSCRFICLCFYSGLFCWSSSILVLLVSPGLSHTAAAVWGLDLHGSISVGESGWVRGRMSLAPCRFSLFSGPALSFL